MRSKVAFENLRIVNMNDYIDIAVWFSESTSEIEINELFNTNDNYIKFKSAFRIDENHDFFDNLHIIILYHELGEKGKNTNEIRDNELVCDFFPQVEKKLNKFGVNKINFLLAVPDFKYKGSVKNTGKIYFAGNLKYKENTESVLEYFSNGL